MHSKLGLPLQRAQQQQQTLFTPEHFSKYQTEWFEMAVSFPYTNLIFTLDLNILNKCLQYHNMEPSENVQVSQYDALPVTFWENLLTFINSTKF